MPCLVIVQFMSFLHTFLQTRYSRFCKNDTLGNFLRRRAGNKYTIDKTTKNPVNFTQYQIYFVNFTIINKNPLSYLYSIDTTHDFSATLHVRTAPSSSPSRFTSPMSCIFSTLPLGPLGPGTPFPTGP